MPVNSTAPYIEYEGDGVLLSFAIPFTFTSNTQLSVILVDELTGDETAQTEGIDYTVTGGDPGTGITFAVEPTSDQIVRIDRVTPRTQPDSFSTKQTYMTATLEAHLDRNTRIIQEMQALLDRTLHFKKSIDPSDVSGEIEAFVPGTDVADKILVFNPTGDGITTGVSLSDITASVAAAAASAAAAAASETNAANSESDAASSASDAAASATAAGNSATAAAASATASAASATNASNSASAAATSASDAAANATAAIAQYVPVAEGTSIAPIPFFNGSDIVGPDTGKLITYVNFEKEANGIPSNFYLDVPDQVGQRVIIVRHDSGTDVVMMDTSAPNNTYLNGQMRFGKNSMISIVSPDGIIWIEEFRNGI